LTTTPEERKVEFVRCPIYTKKKTAPMLVKLIDPDIMAVNIYKSVTSGWMS